MVGLFERADPRQGEMACFRTPDAVAEVARHSLHDWAKRAVADRGMKPARHHLMLLDHLRMVAEGECDRLLVLMPPGSAKSTYASVVFAAWWFHRHPGTSVIAASHTAELAAHFGRGVRSLVNEHAPHLGYALERDNHAAHRFATDNRGSYFATGLGGAITGRRADLVLIDDPVRSHAEAEGAGYREAAWGWYRSELLPRLKPGGRVVLVMTRWHTDDIAGRLLAGDDGWRVLQLPALAEADDPLQREIGDVLWPEWEDRTALERKRVALGERTWAALYQQRPMVDGGNLFRSAAIETVEVMPAELRCVRAWDLAATTADGGRDPDWTVGLKIGRDGNGRFIVADIVRLRAGPLEVAEAIVATAQADGPGVTVGLPQDPGQAGKQQVAWLTARLAGFRVVSSVEAGAKIMRAQPVAAQVAAGNVVLLRGAWNREFIDEIAVFPLGRKDDQVDALSRGFAMLATPQAVVRRIHVPLMAR